MNQSKLQEIIIDQYKIFQKKDSGFGRLIDTANKISSSRIIVISGVRRSGKSTLLKQISLKLRNFYYINFDDERLIDFTVSDFNNLLILWKKQYQSKNILIDEIQNVPNWERFVRRMHDDGYKMFITGPNAKLLSSELSTHLTGLYKRIELYPFSFKELLGFYKAPIKKIYSSEEKAKVLKVFDHFIETGGFPEYIKYKEVDYLKRVYDDIVYRDIIARFGIKKIKSFRELANYLLTNISKQVSYNSLKNILWIKTTMTLRSFVSYLEESYLLFELYKYDFSLKKQYVSDKKIYCIDTGMRNAVSFHFSSDRGRLLENVVFLELKRREQNLFFYKNKNECDFIVEKKNKIIEAIQVTERLLNTDERQEVGGLIEAMNNFDLKEGLILTEFESNKIKTGNKIIKVEPIWKWMIS